MKLSCVSKTPISCQSVSTMVNKRCIQLKNSSIIETLLLKNELVSFENLYNYRGIFVSLKFLHSQISSLTKTVKPSRSHTQCKCLCECFSSDFLFSNNNLLLNENVLNLSIISKFQIIAILYLFDIW